MPPRRLLSVGTSGLVLAVVVLAARYRAVIDQVAGTVAAAAVVLAVVVVLVAAAGWALSACRILSGHRCRPAWQTAVCRAVRSADWSPSGDPATPVAAPDRPELCVRGCGRPAEPWDIAEEWDGTAGHLLPGRPGLCAQCAGRVAADVRPYDPFPPSADNWPPTPDPAFDAFAAEHQELQP
jgi:hypothetical protein